MICPHISLDTLIKTFSQCRELHSENVVCARCKALRFCPECRITVFRFVEDSESISGMVSYYVNLERRLDEKVWNKHIVLPFARQRQYESIANKAKLEAMVAAWEAAWDRLVHHSIQGMPSLRAMTWEHDTGPLVSLPHEPVSIRM